MEPEKDWRLSYNRSWLDCSLPSVNDALSETQATNVGYLSTFFHQLGWVIWYWACMDSKGRVKGLIMWTTLLLCFESPLVLSPTPNLYDHWFRRKKNLSPFYGCLHIICWLQLRVLLGDHSSAVVALKPNEGGSLLRLQSLNNVCSFLICLQGRMACY